MSRKGKGSYTVGYGQPPKGTQFRPGQSGNPKGRPKGTKNLDTLVQEVFDTKVRVVEKGQSSLMSYKEVLLRKTAALAASGNIRAIDRAFALMAKADQKTEEAKRHPTHEELLAELIGPDGIPEPWDS